MRFSYFIKNIDNIEFRWKIYNRVELIHFLF
jgi:hypothetical protein